MRASEGPSLHLFVCANRRVGSPLGPGCGDRGDATYDALKRVVAERGLVARVWVTKTHCLGVCPERGATVARYPGSPAILSEIAPTDAASLVVLPEAPAEPSEEKFSSRVEEELVALETLQTTKVLDLARRLSPGLTLEDIRNPHDFPELDDSDWHYADGVLTGIKSAISAVRALARSRARLGDDE